MPIALNDPRRVSRSGEEDAKIVILSDAPGREEDIQNMPLIGWAGNKLFKDLLPRANINRSECLVGHVVPVRPPNSYFHQLPSIGVDLHEEMAATRKWITAHPRDLVIALGNVALECITGERTISLWRGSLLTNPSGAPHSYHDLPFDVFVMNEPGAIAKDWQLDAICKVDAKKLRKIRKVPVNPF